MLTGSADCSQFHHFTGLEVYGANVEIDFNTLKAIQIYGPGMPFLPHFVRFDHVYIEGLRGKSIEEKCELFVTQLTPLKAAMSGSHVIFGGTIDQENANYFRDQTHLLSFLRNQFLPMFDTSRRYGFHFSFGTFEWKDDATAEAAATNLISHTLELPQIIRCSDVAISTFPRKNQLLPPPPVLIHLPIDAIVNWLNRKSDGISAENQQDGLLNITLSCRIQNSQELWDHMKKVCFLYLFF